MARRASIDTMVLGGGTLVGRREWGERLERAIEAFRPKRIVTFGVGVEDPEFAIRSGLATERDLELQASLLRTFSFVGVRGPRSMEWLAKLGVASSVIGDPALSLGAAEPARDASDGPVILSLANVGDGLAPDADRMRRMVAAGARSVAKERGSSVLGLAMEPGDIATIRRADPTIPIASLPKGVESVLETVRSASVVISERLHPNILAAAVGTPFLALGYKPKTYDFIESVEASDSVLDTREIEVEALIERARRSVGRDPSLMRSRVQTLVELFKLSIREQLDGGGGA